MKDLQWWTCMNSIYGIINVSETNGNNGNKWNDRSGNINFTETFIQCLDKTITHMDMGNQIYMYIYISNQS